MQTHLNTQSTIPLKETAAGLVLAVAASIALTGCFSGGSSPSESKSLPPQPASNLAQPESSSPAWTWKISYRARCENLTCAGAHGWSALSTGEITVGPAPEHAPVSLTLSEGAKTALEEAIRIEKSLPEDTALELCDQQEGADWATLETREGAEEKKRCASPALREAIRPWVEEQPTLGYPDLCWDDIAALQKLTSDLQGCQIDEDCAYFDPALNEHEGGSMILIPLENGTHVPPLAVANRDATQKLEARYLELRNRTQARCGSRLNASPRPARTAVLDLSTLEGPVCHTGRCIAPNPQFFGRGTSIASTHWTWSLWR